MCTAKTQAASSPEGRLPTVMTQAQVIKDTAAQSAPYITDCHPPHPGMSRSARCLVLSVATGTGYRQPPSVRTMAMVLTVYRRQHMSEASGSVALSCVGIAPHRSQFPVWTLSVPPAASHRASSARCTRQNPVLFSEGVCGV